jgi:acyl carrier protein
VDLGRGDETPLYGDNGQLDSLGLVSLVVAVEHELQTRLGVRLTLVSDRAMSGRRSPFATVSSFADYVLAQLAEAARD